MPKMKTHRGAAKRIRKTGTGKFKRSRAFLNKYHIRKSARARRGLRKGAYVGSGEAKVLKQLLPYM